MKFKQEKISAIIKQLEQINRGLSCMGESFSEATKAVDEAGDILRILLDNKQLETQQKELEYYI